MDTLDNVHLSDWGKIIPTVECLIINKDEVLLQKRSGHSKKFPGYWIGPGGHVDSREDFLTAVIRETFEETGVKVKERDIRLRSVAIGRHEDRKEVYIALFFLITLKKKPRTLSSDEGVNEWIPIKKALNLKELFPPFAYYIKHALSKSKGILYTNLKFNKLELTDESIFKMDKDY